MGFPFALAASALLGAGGLLQRRAAEKREKEQARKAEEAARKRHSTSELTRLALLRGIDQTADDRGIRGVNIDPALMQERPFAGVEATENTGRSNFGELLGSVGSIVGGVGDARREEQRRAERQAEFDRLLCQINPSLCATGPTRAELGAVPPDPYDEMGD